jgi:hypothetical protein
MKRFISLFCATVLTGIFAGLIVSTPVQAQTMVDSTVNIDGQLAAARVLNFNGDVQGAYLGVPDLGEADHSVVANIQWAESNDLTWRLNSPENRLELTIENIHGDWSLHYNNWRDQVAQLTDGQYLQSDLNALELRITNRDTNEDAAITLSDISLDGLSLGSFSNDTPWSAAPHKRRWIVDHCFGTEAGFELTATLELENIDSTHENLNRVGLTAGVDPSLGLNCAQPADLFIHIDPAQVNLFRGEETTVAVTLINLGEGPAREVSVQMHEPEELTMTDAMAACEGDPDSGITACPLGDIESDDDFYFEFNLQVNEDASFGPKEFVLELNTTSLNLNSDLTATITVNVMNDQDSIFSDRFQPSSTN